MRVASSLVVALVLAGCKADLGTCDVNAANQVVFSPEGTPFMQGQALIHQSCAGAFCHASGAIGDLRKGAPHGLDFDVNPLTLTSQPLQLTSLQNGIAKVREEAAEMWGEIEAGTMPPGAAGTRGLFNWTNAQKMPVVLDINTPQGKDIARNWLACQAPIVAGVTGAQVPPNLGAVVPAAMVSATTATFKSVYDTLLGTSCKGCHVAGGPYAKQTPLDFTSEQTAFATLVSQPASTTGMCPGRGQLVMPGSCQNSLLFQKLQPAPGCGATMPLGGDPVMAATMTALCAWIDGGAKP